VTVSQVNHAGEHGLSYLSRSGLACCGAIPSEVPVGGVQSHEERIRDFPANDSRVAVVAGVALRPCGK